MNRLNLPPIAGPVTDNAPFNDGARWYALEQRRIIAKALREHARRRRREAEVFGGSGHYFVASELWVQAKIADAYADEIDPEGEKK